MGEEAVWKWGSRPSFHFYNLQENRGKPLNKSLKTILLTFSLLISLSNRVWPADLLPVGGGQSPLISLPMPVNLDEKSYLGLSGKGYFRISQIKGKALIIKVLNIYCPPCQGTATAMTEVYHLIQNDAKLRDQIKIIGIFVGNSSNEVNYFKEAYRIPFPIFPDEDFKIHKALGEIRTPYLICTLKDNFGNHQIVHARPKGLKEAEAEVFLESMLQAFGFNGKDSSRIRENLAVSAKDETATN